MHPEDDDILCQGIFVLNETVPIFCKRLRPVLSDMRMMQDPYDDVILPTVQRLWVQVRLQRIDILHSFE